MEKETNSLYFIAIISIVALISGTFLIAENVEITGLGVAKVCKPDCSCSANTCYGKTCPNKCGGWCSGMKKCATCKPSCTCASGTCQGKTCSDGCGGFCQGTKRCTTPSTPTPTPATGGKGVCYCVYQSPTGPYSPTTCMQGPGGNSAYQGQLTRDECNSACAKKRGRGWWCVG